MNQLLDKLDEKRASEKKQKIRNIVLELKSLKITHKEFCSVAELSLSTWERMRKGDTDLNDERMSKVNKAIEEIRELDLLEQKVVAETMVMNITTGKNKFESEKIINEKVIDYDDVDGENIEYEVVPQTTLLGNKIVQVQRQKRNSKAFFPSTFASLDMVTLSVHLDNYQEQILFETLNTIIGIEPRLFDNSNTRSYKNGLKTRFKHVYDFEGDDVRVHMEYKFWDKESQCDVKLLKVRFNPNKWDKTNQFLKILILIMGHDPYVRDFDVCRDFEGFTSDDIYYNNQAEEMNIKISKKVKTVYFGEKAKGNINLMVYDKRQERIKKDFVDIGYNLVRAETRVTLDEEKRFRLGDEIDVGNFPVKLYSCDLIRFKENITLSEYSLFRAWIEQDKKFDINEHRDELMRINRELLDTRLTICISSLEMKDALEKFTTEYRSAFYEYQKDRLETLNYPDYEEKAELDKAIREHKRAEEKRRKECKEQGIEYKRKRFDRVRFMNKYIKKENLYEPITADLDWDDI